MTEHLDQVFLEELRALMEDDFDTLLQAYLEDSERQFRAVADACDDGDLEQVRRSAHSLKGASSNVGAADLASLCAGLEKLAVQGRTEELPLLVERVRDELREVRDAVIAVHQVH